MKKFEKVVDQLKSLNYEIGKFGIFDYDTLDEVKPDNIRTRDDNDLKIKIDGASAAIGLKILTREEHTILKDAIVKIMDKRYKRLNDELDNLCKERLKDNEN